MSIELFDKGVSTEDLDVENVEKKEIQKSNEKEKEKKETMDFEKLQAVLSVLVENKVMSIRSCGKKSKEKKLINKFRKKSEEESTCHSENQEEKKRVNSASTLMSSCKCSCHKYGRSSVIRAEPVELCHEKAFPKNPQPSVESSQQLNQLYPQQSFDSCDTSLVRKPSETFSYNYKAEVNQRLDKKKLSVQKCLPKKLTTEQWLNSTSRQTSTDTATTSSGYISPTFGFGNKRNRSEICKLDIEPLDVSSVPANDFDSETIIDMSLIQPQKILDEKKPEENLLINSKAFSISSINEFENLKVNNTFSKESKKICDHSCHVILPQCVSATCLPNCRFPSGDDQKSYNMVPSYRHLHRSGGHYVSCCNSPTHSFRKFRYEDNYLALAMNLEDLEFEQEEERRKRRKRKKKRRKERQARARGLMADELRSVQQTAKVLDPEDLPKRARWTIVATACLLLLMSMLLVGVTLRMAPIIDEMVRKENEEMLHSLSRQGAVKDSIALNFTKQSPIVKRL